MAKLKSKNSCSSTNSKQNLKLRRPFIGFNFESLKISGIHEQLVLILCTVAKKKHLANCGMNFYLY